MGGDTLGTRGALKGAVSQARSVIRYPHCRLPTLGGLCDRPFLCVVPGFGKNDAARYSGGALAIC